MGPALTHSFHTHKTARILVIGGGFAGLYAALHLCREWKDATPEPQVTLLGGTRGFTFKPLLPEIIPGKIGPEVTEISLEALSKQYGFNLRIADVKQFDLKSKEVRTTEETFSYDYLILAPGSEPDFHGLNELEKKGLVLNSSKDAVEIRKTIIKRFAQAEKESDLNQRKQTLCFVVAGGGPAGVEAASEIRLFIQETLLKTFKIHPSEPEIILVHSGSRILPGLPSKLVLRAESVLRSRGIRLLLKTRVRGIEDGRILLKGEVNELCSETLIWTAGMRANKILENLPVYKDRRGAILVDEYLKIPEYPAVYVAGDAASVYNWRRRSNYPALAPVAIRQGMLAAWNIMLELTGQPKEEFRFFQTGQIVSLGAGEAIGSILGLSFKGRIGGWIYRMVYFFKLIGIRNKLLLIWHRLRGHFHPPHLSVREESLA